MENSNSISRILDENMLTWPNFKDWFGKLKLVLGLEKIQDIFDKHVLETLSKESNEEERAEWEMMKD